MRKRGCVRVVEKVRVWENLIERECVRVRKIERSMGSERAFKCEKERLMRRVRSGKNFSSVHFHFLSHKTLDPG